MTSDKRNPQSQSDQGPTRSQPNDTGSVGRCEALRLALRNEEVFPIYPVSDGVCSCSDGARCQSPRLHSLIAGGASDATSDRAKVLEWWTRWPDATIGVPTGIGLDFTAWDPVGGDTVRYWPTDDAFFADIAARIAARRGSPVDQVDTPFRVERFSTWAREVDAAPDPGWIAEPVWRGDAYGVMAAESKAGKTWAQLELAVSVATGTPWMGVYPTRKGTVVVFLGEGGKRNTVRRIRAIVKGRGLTEGDLGDRLQLCFRVPHLGDDEHIREMHRVLGEVGHVRLVILDPLYLAAGGANGASLYDMATPLEAAQRVAQQVGAALMVVHHFNQTGTGTSASRMSGAGPEEWGRVLVAVTVSDPTVTDDGRTETAYLHWEFTGSEIVPTKLTVKRTISVEDLHDLTSPMSYDIEHTEAPVKQTETSRIVLDLLDNADDWLATAAVHGRVSALIQVSKKTIENTLKALLANDKVERRGEKATGYSWRSVSLPVSGSAQ